MVTTRLQEHQQQLQQHTPQTHPNHVEAAAVSTPHGAAQASAAAQDPASGADATPTANGAAAPQPSKRAPLKSALKSRRPSQGDEEYREPAEDAAGFGATPGGGLLKKQVRIANESDFERHVFDRWSGDEAEEEEEEEVVASQRGRLGAVSSPTLRSMPRYAFNDSRQLLRYQHFLAGSTGRDPSSSGTSAAGRQAPAGWREANGKLEREGDDGGAGWAVTATLLWMLTSSALIFINARFMVDHGFRYPFALTGVGQISSAALAWAAGRVGLAQLGPPPPRAVMVGALLPVAVASAASLFLGNYAYLGLSVSFINVLKALAPVVTLGAGVLAGQAGPSPRVLLSITLIGLGTALATAQEAGSKHFSWLAFTAFILSIVAEAVRVVLVERLLGGRRLNPLEALLYIGPPTFLMLGAGSWVFEWGQGLSTQGLAVLARRPGELVLAFTTGFLVNLSCFWAIQATSSLTFKVAGCVKNVAVVLFGVMVWGDKLTGREWQGYAISLLGFVVYNVAPRSRRQGLRQRGGRRR